LIETPPQTAAGVRAAIAHLVSIETGCGVPETGGRFLPTLLQSPLFAVGRAEGRDDA
jgi:hypothetical protein